jgi:uncharacterized RDD family membrane protein YckC
MTDGGPIWLPPVAGEAPEPPPEPPDYASFGLRASAYLLDLVVLLAFAAVVGVAITLVAVGPSATDEDTDAGGSVDVVAYAATAAVSMLYYALLMRRRGGQNGQTWGRQVAGVQVVRDDGRPVSGPFAAWRDYVVKGLLTAFTFGIDLLWPLWERENRTLHDIVLRTHVVRVTRS